MAEGTAHRRGGGKKNNEQSQNQHNNPPLKTRRRGLKPAAARSRGGTGWSGPGSAAAAGRLCGHGGRLEPRPGRGAPSRALDGLSHCLLPCRGSGCSCAPRWRTSPGCGPRGRISAGTSRCGAAGSREPRPVCEQPAGGAGGSRRGGLCWCGYHIAPLKKR